MSVTILGKYPHRHDNGHQPGLYPPSQVSPRNTPHLARRTPEQLYHWENPISLLFIHLSISNFKVTQYINDHMCEKYLILKS